MRYLITGGAGFIGSHLADALVTRGDSLVLLDDLTTGRVENVAHLLDRDGVEFVEGTVLDEDVVERCMRSVDACFHLAAAVGVKLIVRKPLDSLLTNVRGSDTVISSAARNGKRLVFTSTSEVYGKNGQGPLAEEADRILGSPFKARWGYATAKAFGEALAHGLHVEQGAETVVVRLFNTVGPRQTGEYGMVLPRFVRQALAGEELTVYGNGTQSRCFVHVLDTVHALVQLVDAPEAAGNVYNVGSPTPVPIIELARKVIERTESSSAIRLIPYEEAYPEGGFDELGDRQPDTSALSQLTGWMPTRTLEETVDDVIAFERSRPAPTPASENVRSLTVA
jgi:UDP-glucose 4-epimerase